VSRWELQERIEREDERKQKAEELSAGDEGQLLFLPAPSFMASAGEE